MAVLPRLGRAMSVTLGALCAVAGVVALGYALEGIGDLSFFRENLLGGIVGAAVPVILCASAFYMAYRLIGGSPSDQEK